MIADSRAIQRDDIVEREYVLSNEVRQFFGRISNHSIADIFKHFKLEPPDLTGLENRKVKRTNAAVDAAFETDIGRGLAEALSSEIIALSDKSDLAEMALRSVCESNDALLQMLESEQSLEERCWWVWKADHQFIDRARNITMAYHWQNGRYHSGFTVSDPSSVIEDLQNAVVKIQDEVQSLEGGRKAQADHFSYHEQTEVEGEGKPTLIHHVAIYLEKPAKSLMEFRPGSDDAAPVIRRQAKELAITYNTRTGRLDVAGEGIGGQKVLEKIAGHFSTHALNDAPLEKVTRNDHSLDRFLTIDPPSFSDAPDGFDHVQVYEIRLRKKGEETSRATFKTNGDDSANERMSRMGITQSKLRQEHIAGVTLQFGSGVDERDEQRKARVILTWPTGVSFENASIADQNNITTWLHQQGITS